MLTRRSFIIAISAFAGLPASGQSPASPSLSPIVTGLDHPWGMAFLPDGSILLTERAGGLRRIVLSEARVAAPIANTPTVDSVGQGGLLGIAIDPAFAENRMIYMSFAEKRDDGNNTAVFRGRLKEDFSALDEGKVIFRQNMAKDSDRHFGSRLVFDREGHLFVTVGDRGEWPEQAQNPASHIGKILRITRDGAPAPGNPKLEGWAPEVWSIGHRNIQGAALHPDTGQLWTAEHGAKGGDEVNTPQSGRNYGWPVITYGRDYSGAAIGEGTTKDGLEQPLHYWDPSIAPSGMAFVTKDIYVGWTGSILVGSLSGAHVSRLTFAGTRLLKEEKLFESVGRFRDVVEAPDGRIYVLTDEAAPDGALYAISAPGEVTSTTQP